MTGDEKSPEQRLRELRKFIADERRRLGEEEVRRGRRGPRTRREIEIYLAMRQRRTSADEGQDDAGDERRPPPASGK